MIAQVLRATAARKPTAIKFSSPKSGRTWGFRTCQNRKHPPTLGFSLLHTPNPAHQVARGGGWPAPFSMEDAELAQSGVDVLPFVGTAYPPLPPTPPHGCCCFYYYYDCCCY